MHVFHKTDTFSLVSSILRTKKLLSMMKNLQKLIFLHIYLIHCFRVTLFALFFPFSFHVLNHPIPIFLTLSYACLEGTFRTNKTRIKAFV